MTLARTVGFLALWLSSCAAGPSAAPATVASPAQDGLPRRCRVHVDHVARTRTTAFEGARRELLATLKAKQLKEGTTFVLETDEPAFLSVRPFDRYADLDLAGVKQKALDDAVGEATIARLDDATHATLVPPHRNEIWSLQMALSYVPSGCKDAPCLIPDDPSRPAGPTMATAAAGRIVEHEVLPSKSDAYEQAAVREVSALQEARAPVSRVVYVSAYGTGRYVTLWLGARREDVDAPLPDIVKAEEAKVRATAEDETVHSFVLRKDLGSS
jgi:hypothetical protein